MYKWFVWRATRPVNKADCMSEWRYFLKYNRNVSIISTHLQYLPSFMQSAMFTGHLARQTICLYVLHMIMKLAYWQFNCIIFGKEQWNLSRIIILPSCAEELRTAKQGIDLNIFKFLCGLWVHFWLYVVSFTAVLVVLPFSFFFLVFLAPFPSSREERREWLRRRLDCMGIG